MKHWPNLLAFASLLLLAVGTSAPQRPSLQPLAELRPFVLGNNAFALELYARLARGDGNLFLSPYCLSAALAMAQAGARGTTGAEIARTAHFPPDQAALQKALSRVQEEMRRIDKEGNVALNTANGLWAQQTYDFNKSYLDLVRTSYRASVEFVDFTLGGAAAARKIDTWINRETKGLITGAMPASAVTPATRLVMASAIYFKGDWSSRFDKAVTRRRAFWTSSVASAQVLMMRQDHVFLYAEAEGVRLVALPYVGDDLSMIVLLPERRDGLPALEKNLDPAHLQTWADRLRPCRVDLELPRFKMASALSLGNTLRQMGITSAFDIHLADFSGMTTDRPLFIQAIEHSSFVEVNEHGTVATSATRIRSGCSAEKEPPRREFHADHPFVFLIRENHSGTILFLGRVINPALPVVGSR